MRVRGHVHVQAQEAQTRLIDEPSKVVPHFILAVLSPRDDHVVNGAPVHFEDDAVVCLPGDLFGAGLDGPHDDVRTRTVADRVAVPSPHHAVDGQALGD